MACVSRFNTLEAAREALDGGELPDLWPAAVEAGWPGLLVAEDRGGAGLAPLEAMLVFEELGRVLAGRSAARPPAGDAGCSTAAAPTPASWPRSPRGEARAALRPRPSAERHRRRLEHRPGARAHAARRRRATPAARVTGAVAWVPDAPGAEHLVVVLDDGRAAHVRAADARGGAGRALRRHALAGPRDARRAPRRRCSSSPRATRRRPGSSPSRCWPPRRSARSRWRCR